jgi:hypothetical protein
VCGVCGGEAGAPLFFRRSIMKEPGEDDSDDVDEPKEKGRKIRTRQQE